MRYRLADGVELRGCGAGALLVARRPLRAVRINRALAAAVRGCRDGREATAAAPAAFEALARRGYLERVEDPALGPLPAVSVVIPVKDRAEELRRCLRSLGRVAYPAQRLEILVVDDGSRDDSPAVARELGARVVPSGGRRLGPAAARNRGAAAASGELLAFIDSDCTASPGWLRELVGRFADPAVAAVGGRVQGMHVATRLDRYEAAMSSLSLGRRERRGRTGSDTFYLPSCNLLVRRAAFLQAGGFRSEMQVGEDVDLTWRLRDRGHTILYCPAGWVWHEHRNRLGAFLRRRFEYGTSEAALHGLHPRRRKRIALPPMLTGGLALAVCGALFGNPWCAAGALALWILDLAGARRRLACAGVTVSGGAVASARLRALGSLAYYLGGHALRYYAVPLAVAGSVWPAAGWGVVALAGGLAAAERRVKGAALGLPWFAAFYLGEQVAYGLGVFWGCAKQRRFGSYRPLVYRRMEMTFG